MEQNQETLTACPVCNAQELVFYKAITDHSVSKEPFRIESCKNCTFLFTNPRPSLKAIGRYYESENYISHTANTKGIFNKIYHFVKKIALKQKLALINEFDKSPTQQILDIGSGTGSFLEYLLQNKVASEGVEPNDNARSIAQANGIKVFKNLNEVEDKKYSTITLWHVLEHLHDLDQYLNFIHEKLADQGTIIIAVPNHLSNDARKYLDHWAAWDVPRHLYHFTPKTIQLLLKKYGFILASQRGMQFDSFYVSLLSEQYKGSNKAIAAIKAVIAGFSSNQIAKKTGNYSSLIYIFKKSN